MMQGPRFIIQPCMLRAFMVGCRPLCNKFCQASNHLTVLIALIALIAWLSSAIDRTFICIMHTTGNDVTTIDLQSYHVVDYVLPRPIPWIYLAQTVRSNPSCLPSRRTQMIAYTEFTENSVSCKHVARARAVLICIKAFMTVSTHTATYAVPIYRDKLKPAGGSYIRYVHLAIMHRLQLS